MSGPQLLALKSAERFVGEELRVREKSYLPNPTEEEQFLIFAAQDVLSIIQRAIVQGETGVSV